MKSRISASIHLFSAGTFRRNSCNGVSSRSTVSAFDCRHCPAYSSFQAAGFENSGGAVHSSAVEDEDFSELGLEISEYSPKHIKLVTEKPDHYVKTDSSRREAGGPLSSPRRPRIKEIVASMGKASLTSNSKLGGSKTVSDTETTGSVSIKNIHPKDTESSRRAILAGKITVGGHVFPVHSLDAVDVVAIRIKNINKETTDYAIHSRCKSVGVGEFVGLSRKGKDVVDAFFNLRNDQNHRNIVKNLNKTILNCNRWSAYVLAIKSEPSEESPNEEARHNLDLQMFDHYLKLRSQLIMKKIALEDLMLLNASIMHIKGQPPST